MAVQQKSLSKFRLAPFLPVIFGIIGIVFLILSIQAFTSLSVIVEWTTASELDTAGFNLFRAQSENGPFLQVNQTLISPSNDPLSGGSYTYEDTTLPRPGTYYYNLQEIELNGNINLHGPITVEALRGGIVEGITSIICLAASIWMFYNQRPKP